MEITADRFHRFWRRVPVMEDGCWEWQGAINGEGYGQFSYSHRKLVPAHRFAYWSIRGPIPVGMQVDHLCRNTKCVRLSHLEAVSPTENVRRSRAAKGHYARPCVGGHNNWKWQPRQGRYICPDCRRDNQRRRRASGRT